MPIAAIVTAAGQGTRFAGPLPKQYALLAGKPMLRWSVERLQAHRAVDRVVVVIDPEHHSLYERAVGDLGLEPPVQGAASRQASVCRGLESLATDPPTLVLIHDAARPCLSEALVTRVIDALAANSAAVPALPVADTLRRFRPGGEMTEVDRRELYRMQTPQGFCFATILAAHRRFAGEEATDDAALVLRDSLPVIAVAGDETNIKVTMPEDLATAARQLDRVLGRRATGIGFDVHRLVPGRRLVLLGVEIPHELGLDGHSDADVALHAVTDAVLGAIGEDDIGRHFPPSDPRWRGADSARFLAHALDLTRQAGGSLEHVDVTIIGEQPRIGPHRPALRAKLAQLTGLQPGQVNVKATTTEGLGFTGRGEGLAAQALATVGFWR